MTQRLRESEDDELHVSHAVVQSGWQQHPAQPRSVIPPRAPRDSYTELFFQYSCLLVMRPRPTTSPGDGSEPGPQ